MILFLINVTLAPFWIPIELNELVNLEFERIDVPDSKYIPVALFSSE